MRRVTLLASLVLMAVILPATPATAAPERVEFRAYWVDAFGEGLFNEAEIDELVAATKAANMNAIVAQVGRRGDCFCNRAMMPRTQAAIAPYPFDPLQTLIDKAHAEGIEVHAWVIATAIWNSAAPPLDPNHVYNTHGPSKTGADNWVMTRYDGSRPGDTYLDPGHPGAADYIVRMYTSIVENYDVDGINFDRIRYPDGLLTNPPTPHHHPYDNAWGYNPVALERFHATTGRSDRPAPDDAEWSQWRREQIDGIVRRVYLESYAIDPSVVISADTITYGDAPPHPRAPGLGTGTWEDSRPYRETLQDWRGWMEEGILDLNLPMNYKREWCHGDPIPKIPAGCFDFDQRAWYEHWNEFIKDHQYDRHAAIGSALYLNHIDESVVQVRKALEPSAAGNTGVGWVGYSYRTPDFLTNTGQRSGDASRAELTRALTEPSEYDPVTPPVFADPAVLPATPWKDEPSLGHVMGTVRTGDGTVFDQVSVELYHRGSLVAVRPTDGIGWFGFVDLAPGRYKVKVDGDAAHGRRVLHFDVRAGEVEILELTPNAR